MDNIKPEVTNIIEPQITSTFHVFLLLGQSNMAGFPKAQDLDKENNPRILVLGFDDNPGYQEL